jgi:hypothetical protein
MPFTRPAVISDCVSLSDKVGRAERPFVPKNGAFDSVLLGDCVINVFSPDEDGVGHSRSQEDDLPGPNALAADPSVAISICAVVSLIEFQTRFVAIAR